MKGTSPGGSIIKVPCDPSGPGRDRKIGKGMDTMQQVTVKYKVLDPRAQAPAHAPAGTAAADVCALLDAPLPLAPMEEGEPEAS